MCETKWFCVSACRSRDCYGVLVKSQLNLYRATSSPRAAVVVERVLPSVADDTTDGGWNHVLQVACSRLHRSLRGAFMRGAANGLQICELGGLLREIVKRCRF